MTVLFSLMVKGPINAFNNGQFVQASENWSSCMMDSVLNVKTSKMFDFPKKKEVLQIITVYFEF